MYTNPRSAAAGNRISWMLASVVLLACSFAILLGPEWDVTSEAEDQNQHHLLVIQSFASQWPSPDVRDYRSATAPLWHLIQSVPLALGAPIWALRLLMAVAGALLVLSVGRVAACLAGDERAAWFALPMAANPYLLSGSIWITTDVPACLALTAACGATLYGRAGASALLAIGTGVRQTGVWMAPALALMTWCSPRSGPRLIDRARASISLCLPTLAVLGVLVLIWGGLTPPYYRDIHDRGANLATPAHTLTLIALIGAPFVSWRRMVDFLSQRRGLLIALAAIGLLMAVVVPTSYDRDEGRWGGPLWIVVKYAPVLWDRSAVFIVFAPVGLLILFILTKEAHEARQDGSGLALSLAVLSLTVVNTANSQCWERYTDLPLLVLLPWMSALGSRGQRESERQQVMHSVLALAMIQLALSARMVLLPLLGKPVFGTV